MFLAVKQKVLCVYPGPLPFLTMRLKLFPSTLAVKDGRGTFSAVNRSSQLGKERGICLEKWVTERSSRRWERLVGTVF